MRYWTFYYKLLVTKREETFTILFMPSVLTLDTEPRYIFVTPVDKKKHGELWIIRKMQIILKVQNLWWYW